MFYQKYVSIVLFLIGKYFPLTRTTRLKPTAKYLRLGNKKKSLHVVKLRVVWRDGNPQPKKWKSIFEEREILGMLSAHVGVMSAAAFGDLPTVTTVGRSVGIFPQNNDFCSKCWCPKMKSILETSRILRKPASINSDPGSHCQPSSWMTWADLWWFRIIYSIMWILISEPSFVSTGKAQ